MRVDGAAAPRARCCYARAVAARQSAYAREMRVRRLTARVLCSMLRNTARCCQRTDDVLYGGIRMRGRV